MTKYLILILYFFYLLPIYSQKIADFVIIEKPQNLVIYNKFKQAISGNQKQLFSSYKPYQVKKSSGLFNDGVRGYMELDVNNESYYFVKDANGDYYNKAKSGEWFFFNDKKTYYDSIIVLTNNKLLFYNMIQKKEIFLNEGDVLIRIFEDANLFYCKLVKNNTYGKVNLSGGNNSFFNIINNKKANRAKIISSELKEKIAAKFNESNKLFKKLYAFFNTENEKNLIAPLWVIKTNNYSIEAVLTHYSNTFENSNKYLINQIQNIVLGTDLKVKLSANKIIIGF
ncbi:MAG: hypothetical protein V1773_00970 [bacterium]